MKKIGVIILAAGASNRLGTPKQLLKKDGKTLVMRVCEAALTAHPDSVFVITGSSADEVEEEIRLLPVKVIYNEMWSEGISSSIRRGIELLIKFDFDAAVILPCDQVYINSKIIADVTNGYNENCKVSYSVYGNNKAGPPVLFDKSLFDELLNLRGNTGTKMIVAKHLDSGVASLFVGGEIDIDNLSDLHHLA